MVNGYIQSKSPAVAEVQPGSTHAHYCVVSRMTILQAALSGASYNQADWVKASTLIDNFEWNSLLSEDVDESWSNWSKRFLLIMDECIPKKTLPKRKNLPWLTKRLISSIRKRNLLYKQGKLSGNLSKYKLKRNKVTSELRRAKRDFFRKGSNLGKIRSYLTLTEMSQSKQLPHRSVESKHLQFLLFLTQLTLIISLQTVLPQLAIVFSRYRLQYYIRFLSVKFL